jgi:hypothetical protein
MALSLAPVVAGVWVVAIAAIIWAYRPRRPRQIESR